MFKDCESGFLDNIMLALFPRVYIKDEFVFEACPPASTPACTAHARTQANTHMHAHKQVDTCVSLQAHAKAEGMMFLLHGVVAAVRHPHWLPGFCCKGLVAIL